MKKKRRRFQGRSYHHMTPWYRKEQPYHGDKDYNVILIDIERHDYWHRIFKNKTLEEVILLLQRLALMKKRDL